MDLFTNFKFSNPIITTVWGLFFIVLLLAHYCLLLRFLYNQRNKKQIRLYAKWEGVIFQYLEGKQSPQDIVDSIQKSDYGYFLIYLKNYLITVKGEDFKRLSALLTETRIFPYLTSCLKCRKRRKRSSAAFFLGLARVNKAKEYLRQGLKDHAPCVVLNCAEGLAKLGAIDTIGDILFQYRHRKNYSRDILLCVLFEFGNDVCQPLLQQLLEEKDDSSRIIIVEVLGHLRYYPAGREILHLLDTSPTRELRAACIEAIGRTEYIDALPTLRRCLDDSDWQIRSNAIKALGNIKDISVEKRLIEYLGDENWWVRYQTAGALFNLSEEGKKTLRDTAEHSKNEKASSVARMLLTEKTIGV